jgi:ribonuclease T2
MRPIARWRGPRAQRALAHSLQPLMSEQEFRPAYRFHMNSSCSSAYVLAACLLLGSVEAGTAQNAFGLGAEPPCVLDKCLNGGVGTSRPKQIPDPGPGPRTAPPDAGFSTQVAPGAFDFYVLALSWSPAFCQTAGASRAEAQCEPGGRLGFVVHGLWPQNAHGYPSDCDSNAQPPSRMALDVARNIYPDLGLARHEWRKHGACTGLSPTAYFNAVGRARAAVVIPESFRAPTDDRTWQPMAIARAFVDANPRLRTDSMAVTCRSDMLEEVRICFSKDLRGYVSCPEVVRSACRRSVEVPPVL